MVYNVGSPYTGGPISNKRSYKNRSLNVRVRTSLSN